MSILEYSPIYAPQYPQFIELFKKQQRAHWIHEEIKLQVDVEQWKNGKITPDEKQFIKSVLRLFTESDKAVASGYYDKLIPAFKNNEVRMMLNSFANMECYDDKTEILTNNGWKYFKDLENNDTVAQYDKDSRDILFVKPTNYIAKQYVGEMHHYKNSTTDIKVTPGHRLYLKHPSSGVVSIQESQAGKWGGNYLYPVGGYHSSGETELSTLERLLIALQADGTIRALCQKSSDSWRTVDFSFNKLRKIERLKSFIDELGISCNPRNSKDGFVEFTLRMPDGIDLHNIKNFNFLNIDNISHQKAKDIVDEILFWDGTVSGNTKAYYNTNKSAIDKFQAICTIANIRSHISVNRPSRKVQILNNKYPSITKTCYVVNLGSLEFKTYPYRKEVDYEGMVYCVTVPSGLIVTRRNGCVAVCGNCEHQLSYALLNDTLGFGESFYYEFLEWSEMKEKYEFMIEQHDTSKPKELASYLAKQMFIEGVSLFSSFVMLINFDRRGLLPGMADVVRLSSADESLHVEGLSQLFKHLLKAFPEIVTDDFKKDIYDCAREVIRLEDAFIDLVFKNHDIKGLTTEETKSYARYVTDARLTQLGLKKNFGMEKNPIQWAEDLLGSVFGNFFEREITQYSKANLSGEYNGGY